MTEQLTELSLRPEMVSSHRRTLMRSLASLWRWKVHPLSTIIRLRLPYLPLVVAVDHLAVLATRRRAGIARIRGLATAEFEASSSFPGRGKSAGMCTRYNRSCPPER